MKRKTGRKKRISGKKCSAVLAVWLSAALTASTGGCFLAYAGEEEALYIAGEAVTEGEGTEELASESSDIEDSVKKDAETGTGEGPDTEVLASEEPDTEVKATEETDTEISAAEESDMEVPTAETPDTEVLVVETPVTETPDMEFFTGEEAEGTDSAEDAAVFSAETEAVLYAAPGETVTISTADELKTLRDGVNGGNSYSGVTVTLTANIDLSNEVWTPIGTIRNYFSGTFEGGGHTISGLNVRSTADYQGLFGFVESGSILNLSVEGSVTGANHVGGIVGYNRGTITNCTFQGTVNGSVATPGSTGPFVGGIAGWSGGTVQRCINNGSVNGTLTGGVVGWNSGTVTNCLNNGSVSGTYAGGIAVQSAGTVSNCFNTGTVSGNISGVVAWNYYGSVTNCYYLSGTASTGVGQGGGSAQGKSAEELASGGTAHLLQGTQGGLVWGQTIGTDPYPVLTTDTTKKVVKITFQTEDGSEEKYKNTGQTIESSDFPGGVQSDAYYAWRDEAGNPVAAGTVVTEDLTVQYKFFMDGEGTEESPYLIPDAQTLKTFRDYVNEKNTFAGKYVELTADIDLNNETWTPIGNHARFNYDLHFDGSFDGGGHTIQNLYVYNSDNSRMGLFGCLNGGTVRNLSVSGKVSGPGYVGGIVGESRGGFITDCSFSGTVACIMSGTVAGGIVGLNSGSITNCISEGKVTIDTGLKLVAGGITGSNEGNISDCENRAEVSGGSTIGGIAGESSGVISGCTNRGTVKAEQERAGGIAGQNKQGGTITGCVNSGQITGAEKTGGIVGESYGSIISSVNDGVVNGTETTGGIVGDNLSTVVNCVNSAAVTGSSEVGGIAGKQERATSTDGNISNSSNTGSVTSTTGSDEVGGIAGYQSSSRCSVTNCYFLEGTADNGIGSGYGSGTAVAKTADAYGSGEVAHLLQGTQESLVWGQTLGTDAYPVLTGEEEKRVCKVTFVLPSEQQTVYVNSGGRIETLPDVPAENQGQKFTGWKSQDGNSFTADTVVSADMTVTAVYEKEETVSIELHWGTMQFTYLDAKWNPEALAYEEGGWTADDEGGDRITAENTGETAVTVSYEYKQTDTAVSGVFTEEYEQTDAADSGSFADGGEAKAAGTVSLSSGEKWETRLILDGKPSIPSDSGSYSLELGTVTVTIGGE
ncbi:MAG: GLUG motif-containing protein [Eubacteriales bacterium]|nr:GLUG motif-containing protein [Eubacteriales bacterium]